MRVYLAGASGVIGSRLVPLLVSAGHTVGAMTRSAEKADRLAAMGAEPIVCDVFDRAALATAVRTFSPDVVLHELTDLPDDVDKVPDAVLLNARIRVEGTRNLLDAVQNWEHTKIVAQSIAWPSAPGRGRSAGGAARAHRHGRREDPRRSGRRAWHPDSRRQLAAPKDLVP